MRMDSNNLITNDGYYKNVQIREYYSQYQNLPFTLFFGLHALTFYTLPSAQTAQTNFAIDLFDKQIKFIEVNSLSTVLLSTYPHLNILLVVASPKLSRALCRSE